MPKVSIDVRMMRFSGIGTYIQNLVRELVLSEKYEWNLLGDEELIRARYPKVSSQHFQAPVYSIREQVGLAFCLQDADLLHSPHYNAPLIIKRPLVVTIHDLIHFRFPEFFGWARVQTAKLMLKGVLKKATRIIAVSEATRMDLMEMFHVKPEKIRVIKEGAGNRLQRLNEISLMEEARKKYNLPNNFLIYVGNLKAHKNVERLLKAYSKSRTEGLLDGLVVIGKMDKKLKKSSQLPSLLESEGVRALGFLPQADLLSIFSQAKGFILPSLWEGFGLPILEAFQLDVPVACSRIPSHQEIAGVKGLYFDPLSIEEMSQALGKLSTDKTLRSQLIHNGTERLKLFSWKKAAQETQDVYEEALGV